MATARDAVPERAQYWVVPVIRGLLAAVAAARDWIAVGALTALLAIVFLLLPPDAVTAVGLLGGYLVIVGVYLIIGGFSLKWAAAPAESGTAAGTEQQS